MMKTILVTTLLGGVLLALGGGSSSGAETLLQPPRPPPEIVSVAPVTVPLPPHSVLAVPAVPVSGARIQFATPSYDFGKVLAGQLIKHEYIFTNTGDQTLEIRDVRPSCGCTTAGAWQQKVEPGQTGSIPIQFNGANFNGPVHKTIMLTCNASNQPSVILELKGAVWRPIEVNPMYVYFNLILGAETNQSRIVRIVNNLETPLTLSEPEINSRVFSAEIKPVRPGKEFELLVKTLQTPAAGTHQANILVKTSSTNLPIINVSAMAVVQQTLSVLPAQLMLPAGPLVSDTRLGVTIRNNAQAPISVFDPAFSVPGVETQLREFQNGRVFNIILTFPPGFEVPAGEKTELSFKTSHPQFQTMQVPLIQMPRLAQSPLIPPGSALKTDRSPRRVGSTNLSQSLPPMPPLPEPSTPLTPAQN